MAATKDRLKQDLAAALRAKDEAAKSNIRMMLAAITVEEVAGASARELSDAEELEVIGKELRKRKDSAATYAEAGRQDLAEKEASEAEFIAGYLPPALTEDEIGTLVAEALQGLRDAGEEPSMKQMGKVMKLVGEKTAGRADGAVVAKLVKAALAG